MDKKADHIIVSFQFSVDLPQLVKLIVLIVILLLLFCEPDLESFEQLEDGKWPNAVLSWDLSLGSPGC